MTNSDIAAETFANKKTCHLIGVEMKSDKYSSVSIIEFAEKLFKSTIFDRKFGKTMTVNIPYLFHHSLCREHGLISTNSFTARREKNYFKYNG